MSIGITAFSWERQQTKENHGRIYFAGNDDK